MVWTAIRRSPLRGRFVMREPIRNRRRQRAARSPRRFALANDALPEFRAPLCKQPLDGLRLHQLAGLVEVVVDDRFGVDAEGVVDGGEDFHRVDGVFGGAAAGGVALAVDVAALDAGAREGGGVAIGP